MQNGFCRFGIDFKKAPAFKVFAFKPLVFEMPAPKAFAFTAFLFETLVFKMPSRGGNF